MSYSFNIPNSRPMIQESQSMKNNGGGGNTGYFQRGQKEEEENLDFKTKDYPDDSFEHQGTLDEIQNQSFLDIIKNLFNDFIEMIKGFFGK